MPRPPSPNQLDEQLVTVVADGVTLGIVLMQDACVRAAPSLRWCLGRRREDLSAEFRRRGWSARIRPCPADCVLEATDDEP